jgi:kinesin family protein 1
MKDEQTILIPPPDHEERMRTGKGAKDAGQKTFAFDKSYWSFNRDDPHFAGQDNLHNDLGKPLLDNAFQGYNNCIFAYGQTGSGKSYSMMGYGKEAGVIPKICQDMFERIGELQQDKNLRCTVEVSYLEIYNERVRDLLNPSTKGNLKVREHPSTGPYVEDLAKLVVSSFNEIEHLMDEGNKARTVAATNMNETSSRSHAVFTLTLTQKRHDVQTNMAMEKVAKISLVDLAGSERATSTGATGARLKEGAEINRSLSTLGRVIAALADLSDGKKKRTGKGASQVPYRDSVLTWLLKDSLGGNSMTAMIAAISPADINFDETLSTLRYADSAKRIKNHAVVNEDANARMIRELKEELATLRSRLSGGGGGGGISEEVYPEGTPLDKQMVSIVQADGTIKQVSKAEIAEQLNQSEKLYSDLNQTWEQKLAKTEEIHKEREAALEELGISIEKGFVGLHTPKKMPHLVNLSDDPLLAECLVYNLKPGTTTVGNVDTNAAHTSEIRLNGSRILHEHCTFENVDNVVTLVPKEGAAVMVNGKRILEPKRLRSGYRVILGDFHIFRFNHPMEARAERAEQSNLRHSIIASQIQDYDKVSPSQSPKPGHERSLSKAVSEADWESSRPESPMPVQRGRDSDWSFARREAAGAILGPDQKIAGLTDEELNILFEDVQRARAERAGRDLDDDMDSVTSYPIREKYMSNGTLDNFSLDTALTMPSTPKQGEVEDKMREVREEMQMQLDKQKEEYQDQLKSAEAANVEVEEIKKEKARMEETLREVKESMLKQLEAQRKEFEGRLQQMASARPKSSGQAPLTEEEKTIAGKVVEHWRGRRYVRMAESVLQSASNLKEAQIMSHEMDESVVFQFTIVDVGHDLCSSYDMVLNGISSEGDDLFLEDAIKPCVGVRVIDYRNTVVHLWSLEKLQDRVRLMRQMHQYMDRPEYLQHFAIDNPFIETCMPQYTHIGDVDVPLATVFESRVQDFSLDVLSPYTSHDIGIIKLSLEPSSARAPSSTLKFNVVMHDMVGFAEREGTEVHGQLFIPGVSEEGGVTTTQMIKDFDEGPIRFESVHSMSVPMFSPTDVSLRVAIFAKVSSMHLDKLLSWDDMRDNVQRPQQKRKNARIAESQFYTEEMHDIFARIQILELSESGEYLPVEVIQTSDLDKGSFQLHQGLQRRIVVNLTHSSGEALPWEDVSGLRVGCVQLVDHVGKTPDLSSPTPELPLKLITKPVVKMNANGTSNVTVVGQWDSSVHGSLLLDRVTADKYKVQMSLLWDVTSEKLVEPMTFSIDVCSQILSRSYVRSTSMFASLWQSVRIVHSITGVFSIAVRPTPVKRAGDLWRMNTQNDYVKGEEGLMNWTPRGVSLIRDYIAAKRRKQRLAEIEAAQPILSKITFPAPITLDITNDDGPSSESDHPLSERDSALLTKYLNLWKLCHDPITSILTPSNVEPPTNGVTSSPTRRPSTSSSRHLAPTFQATISQVPKNTTILKGGYLLTPSTDSTRWVRRFVELRRPYLHIHSVPDGEEVCIVSLRNSRVDHQPQIAKLLKKDRGAGDGARGRAGDRSDEEKVFAVYGTDNTWLFKTRSEREKVEWIFKIDQAYFGGSGNGSGNGSSGEEDGG